VIHVNPNIFPQIKEIVDFQADLIVKNIFPGLIIQKKKVIIRMRLMPTKFRT